MYFYLIPSRCLNKYILLIKLVIFLYLEKESLKLRWNMVGMHGSCWKGENGVIIFKFDKLKIYVQFKNPTCKDSSRVFPNNPTATTREQFFQYKRLWRTFLFNPQHLHSKYPWSSLFS